MAKILNVHTDGWVPTAVYVGRKKNTSKHFGNPFEIGKHGTRDEVCDKYAAWLKGTHYLFIEPKRRQWILDNIHLLANKKLLCFCAPERCHAETLRQIAKEKANDQKN